MAIILRVSEYGTMFGTDIITFFDILKKGILNVEELLLSLDSIGLRQNIGLKTIPFKN